MKAIVSLDEFRKNLSDIVEVNAQGINKYTLPGLRYLELFTNQQSLGVNVK